MIQAGLAALLVLAAGPVQDGTGPAAPDARALLLELTRTARLPGSPAERAAADLCAGALAAAGLEVTVAALPCEVRLPVRQDLQAFAGPGEALAFLERFEAFDWAARPTWPVPPVYREAPTADVRAALVDAGAGAPADYERLAAQRVEVRGAVVLVRSAGAPADLAREAEARGAAALLVERPLRAGAATWPEGPWATDRQLAGGALAPGCELPAAPVRAAEAAALRARLRARRVRGAGGEAETVQVGPGPVEVRLALDVPVHATTQLLVTGRSRGAGPIAPRVLAPLATYGPDALAAAETVAALLVAAEGPSRMGLVVALGPPPPATEASKGLAETLQTLGLAAVEHGRELGALLAYETDLRGTGADGFVLVDRLLDPGLARVRAVARFASYAVDVSQFMLDLEPLFEAARTLVPWRVGAGAAATTGGG